MNVIIRRTTEKSDFDMWTQLWIREAFRCHENIIKYKLRNILVLESQVTSIPNFNSKSYTSAKTKFLLM